MKIAGRHRGADKAIRPGALTVAAVGPGLTLTFAFGRGALAQQNPVTAIDIALEPDATMIEYTKAANARLRESFPKGFALAEPFSPFTFSAAGASVYQLGSFGTARKELKALTLAL
jgi:hypothetical protein